MAEDTEERLSQLEKRLNEFDAVLERLMLLAAKHPMGRQILKRMALENSR